MIRLSDKEPFANGSHRDVYRHPGREDRCLKLMTEDWKDSLRWKKANVISRMIRPNGYYSESHGELYFSNDLERRLGSAGWNFVAQARGFVDSDLGPVLEVNLIRDYDGKISRTLKEHVWRHGLLPTYEQALDVFWHQLDEHWVFVAARPDNLAVQMNADGTCQIFAIDGFRYGRLIPIGKWFRVEQRRILAKRKRMVARKLEEIVTRRQTGGDIGKNGMIKSTQQPPG